MFVLVVIKKIIEEKEEQVFQDENFVKELLNMIPEVDQNNEEIKVFYL